MQDVLVPLFEEYGRIYELRLMLDFNGAHRGFGYVKFCEIGSALAAAQGLDRRQVRNLISPNINKIIVFDQIF